MSAKINTFLLYLFPFAVSAFTLFDRPFFYFSAQDPRNTAMYYEIDITAVFYICYAYFAAMFCYVLMYLSALFNSKKFIAVVSALVYTASYIYVLHFLLTGFHIHYNSVFALFDTNVPEAKEFLQTLKASDIAKAVFLTLAYAGVWGGLINRINKDGLKIKHRKKLAAAAFVFCLIGAALLEKHSFFSNLEPVLSPVQAFVAYRREEQNIARIIDKIDPSLMDGIKSGVEKNINETYVVVIGESASRDLHPLYAEDAVASSPLNKKNLILFNKIYASAPITMLSLFQALFINPEKNKTVDFVDLAKKAGFKTFWISNQFRASSFGDNPTAVLSRRADKASFINHSNPDIKNYADMPLDENLLPPFQDALNDPAAKKIIFLHLFGSHAPYENRYPENMNIENKNPDFEKGVQKRTPLEKQRKEVRAYAKSMYYTDTVLKQIIEKLNDKGGYSSLIYFSDHGANPKAAMNRNPDDKSILEVPFFLWASSDYKNLNKEKIKNAENARNKLYRMDRLKFTLADWMNLSHPLLSIETDSLFSPKLIETTEQEIKQTPSVL